MLEDRKVKLSCSQEQEHQPRGKHCRIGVVLSRFLMISSIAMVCVYGITTLRNEIKLDEATSASNLEHEQNLINEELPKSGTVSSDVYQDETDSKPITTENDHSKPRFVFHVGPQKMGTTTLQHDLGNLEWDNFLENDNWHYLNHPRTFTDGTTMDAITIKPILNHPVGEEPYTEFFKNWKTELKKLRQFNRNVVYVHESYSVMFGDQSWMYKKFKEAAGDAWEVEIICGYRPYYDWIQSFWTQVVKRNEFLIPDPGMQPWRNDDGSIQTIRPMFPNYYGWIEEETALYADAVLEGASQILPVTILDIQNPKGLVPTFICDILRASNSCQEVYRKQKEKGNHVANKGSPHYLLYDVLALGAANKGLVDETKWNRTDVTHSVMNYVEKELHQTVTDLPMICPDDKTMDGFLEKSMSIDATYMAEVRSSDPGRDARLRDAFEKKKRKNSYCYLDAEAALEQEQWQEFFKSFA